MHGCDCKGNEETEKGIKVTVFNVAHVANYGYYKILKNIKYVTVCSALLLLLVNFHSPHPCSTPANQPHPPHQLTLFTWALSCSSSVITWTFSCTQSIIKPVYILLLSFHSWPDRHICNFYMPDLPAIIHGLTPWFRPYLLLTSSPRVFSGKRTSLLSLTSIIACSCMPVAVWCPPILILSGEPRTSSLVNFMSMSATGIVLPAANSVFSDLEPCLLPYTFCLYLFSYLADCNNDHLNLVFCAATGSYHLHPLH